MVWHTLTQEFPPKPVPPNFWNVSEFLDAGFVTVPDGNTATHLACETCHKEYWFHIYADVKQLEIDLSTHIWQCG